MSEGTGWAGVAEGTGSGVSPTKGRESDEGGVQSGEGVGPVPIVDPGTGEGEISREVWPSSSFPCFLGVPSK